MIFVTLGTAAPFDELIQRVDWFVKQGVFKEPVVCQIGNGKYKPTNCEFFTFKPSLDLWYLKASVVVAHGGTGTVLELLRMGKPFVAVANPLVADDHQAQFLSKLESLGSVLWCRDLTKLPAYVRRALDYRPQPLPFRPLAYHLIELIERS